ncbi:TAXI family TRAP transporter solute-binding subunit [Halorubrum cibi]|uniref:TRAP transporter solute receptor, TAXI family n=1 Tax=Halorubrum cibi TaxID=413815 RepID=A0A521B8T8_9EURY|nr:TAXI family TRAP transporter solute-binding subunit [Halorubrum cibi]SMO43431.1 hypothetical protein SAMN06264867_10291 [Halorubrum cibi]
MRDTGIERRRVIAGIAGTGLIGMAGCSGGGNGDDGGDDTGDEGRIITWHAGGTGGTYFPLSGEFEGIIEDVTDYDLQVSATGASVENVGSLASGDADFALIQNDIAFFARNGSGLAAFEGDPIENLRGVATLYPETIHVIVGPDADIGSFADMEGARINTGDLGSGTQVNALQILESVAGLTPEDFDEQNTDFTQAADQIRDGDVDVAFVVGGWPVGAVEELATTVDIGVLNMSDDEREAALDGASWFAEDTIPGGTYGGIDGDVDTVSVQAMIATRAELESDIVETVTAAIFDNVDRLEIKSAFIDVETAQNGMSIELHEGAARYFE